MKTQEIIRLQAGQKLLGKIEKLTAQVKSLEGVTHIQLKTKTLKNSGRMGMPFVDETIVNYDIPLNIFDKMPAPLC